MTIETLYRKPNTWTREEMAKDRSGEGCDATDSEAVCFCLLGAIDKCYPLSRDRVRVTTALYREIRRARGLTLRPPQSWKRTEIASWNDSPTRTIREVRKVVRQAGV